MFAAAALLLLPLLSLLLLPLCARGQETATATTLDEVVGDVTDLGDVVGDAMPDLTSSDSVMEDLDDDAGDDDDDVVVLDDDSGSATAGAEGGQGEACDDGESAPAGDAGADEAPADADADADADAAAGGGEEATDEATTDASAAAAPPPAQSGPFVDILGEVLLSLEMVDETHAQVHQHYTNEALSGKKVVGLYFSADW